MISQNKFPEIKTKIPGPKSRNFAKELYKYESAGISSIENKGTPIFLESTSKCMLKDIDGNTFLDLTSSYGVSGIGYCTERVSNQIGRQAKKLTHSMIGFFSNEMYLNALKAICESVGRWKNTQVLLTSSGSEAVEVAIKIALLRTGKPGIISFYGGFHGQSLGSLAVTSQKFLRFPFCSFISNNVKHIPYPNLYRYPFTNIDDNILNHCLENIRFILSHDQVGGIPIGAILFEPMQNANGYIVPPDGFIKGLRELCDEFDILLIADEIFTGYGRTGYWLLVDSETIVPDLICVGKSMTGGLPIAACVGSKEIMTALKHSEIIPLHGSTFMGNALGCLSATETINEIKLLNLVERSRLIGNQILNKMQAEFADHPFIGDIRGKGMAIGIEFVQDKRTKIHNSKLAFSIQRDLLNAGIVTLITGLSDANVIAICPPLVIEDEQVEFMLENISKTMSNYRK